MRQHPMRRRLIWFAGLLVVSLVFAGLLSHFRKSPDRAETLRFRNWDNDVAYVGDAACAECHAAIYSKFKRSEMGNSFYVPTAEQLAEDGWENSTTYEPIRNFYYRAMVDEGEVFQEEYRLNESGEKTFSLRREASYCIGSGAHGRSFVTESNGYLTALAIGRYRDAGKWDLSPGYESFNLRFERPIPDECMACHAGGASYVAGSGNRYQLPIEQGIRCENCHGPGSLHIAERRRTPLATSEIDDTIVNPARVDYTRQNDICLVCHLIPDAQFPVNGKKVNDFRPGMLLADFREDYLVHTATTDQFGFASHGPRTAQSRCWTEGETAGQMTCISCHDPHSQLSEVPEQRYVNRCLSCHDQGDCKRPERISPDENCTTCHMQRSKVTNIPHVVFTDHWIRARPQADSTESRVVEESRRHSADGSRIKMVSFWTRDASKREQSRSAAIAQIRYFDLHPADRSILDLKAAVQTLQRITKSNSTDVEAWFVLGVAQFHLSNMKAAAENYRRAAECPGGCEKAYAHAGEAYEGIGMFEQAKEMYEKSISQWPEFLAPYDRLAALHMREGRFPEAIELLRHELELNPQRAATWNQLGMTSYMHDQDFEKARAAIRKSLELNPDLLQAYVALGFMCSREGRRDEALEAYDAALRISPDHLESLLGAASLHEEAGNLARASELLSHAAQTAPTHPEVMQRLRRRTVRQR